MRPYLYEILLHMNPIILLLKFTSTELLYISTEQLLNCHGYIRKEQSLKSILPVIITFKENYQMTKTLVYFNCTVKKHYILILHYLRAT